MLSITRRDFLRMGGALAAYAGLSIHLGKAFAAGLESLAKGLPKILWLQGQSCSGCSVSLLNATNPDIVEIITQMSSLVFHQTISAATGDVAMQTIDKLGAGTDPYVLVIEGSIPVGIPEACMIGGRNLVDLLPPLVRRAKFVVGAGTCATYGGLPSAEGNPTGAVSLLEFMTKQNIRTDRVLVNCPSCPIHPEAMVGILAYLASRGYPRVNPTLLTPNMFFARSTHDDCPRYHYYSKHVFAKSFGDSEGCLFKLGCLGMLSFTECPRIQWNGGVNWCIRAGAPCVGCSHPQFGKLKKFPFYRKCEAYRKVDYTEGIRKEVAT